MITCYQRRYRSKYNGILRISRKTSATDSAVNELLSRNPMPLDKVIMSEQEESSKTQNPCQVFAISFPIGESHPLEIESKFEMIT